MLHPKMARFKPPLIAAALIVAYQVTAYLSLEVLRGPDGRTALYTSNAFLLSGLLLLRGKSRVFCLVGSVVGVFLLLWLRGTSVLTSANSAFVAAASCLTGAFLARWVLPQPRLKNPKQAIKLLFFVAAPSALVSAVLSASYFRIAFGSDFVLVSTQWFAASFVGCSMVLPALLMLATPDRVRQVDRSPLETIALYAAIAGLIAAPYVGLWLAALILAFPAANLFALRLGGRKAAMAMLAISLSVFVYPFVDGEVSTKPMAVQRLTLLGFQIYTIVVFYNAAFTALAVDQQTRVKRQLERRTAMARAARARALDASRAKTEFLATMSHEVRTPLNSILGFSQLLDRRDDLSKDARRHVGMIQASGESLLTIVNDILDFSRVEAGKLALDPRPTNLAQAAAEAIAIVEPAAQQKGLKVSMTTIGPVEAAHMVDDHRIRQVLLNFLNNAVKFTDAGEIKLDLEITQRGDRDRVRISVTDSGVGIAPEAQARLFERFTQADSSISRSYGGAGLGLSICKGLVELMGGKVGVKSTLGQGSSFWLDVTLPRAEALVESAAAEGEASAVSARILLVDDNAANRELGVTVLKLLGCEADVACDGREAIEAATTHAYDLILMDVHMPGMDGLAATRGIRQLKGAAGRVPIVAMSADVLPEQIERCRAAGMVDHVAKPINVEQLFACIVHWTSEDPGRREDAAA